jgi:hypothetical protein
MPLKLIETRRTSQEELQRVKMDQVDFDWLAEHTEEIGEKYKGKCIAVVNKEIFIGDSIEEVMRDARSKYPDRDAFVEYVPVKKRVMVL